MLKKKIEELEKSMFIIKLQDKVMKMKKKGITFLRGRNNDIIQLTDVPNPKIDTDKLK